MKVLRNLETSEGYVLDPFSKDIKWVYCAHSTQYFFDNYGLYPPEVWNLAHGLPKDYIHICPVCGNPIGYSNFNRGFTETCSRSCGVKLSTRRGRTGFHNDRETELLAARNRFINAGNIDDECYLYCSYHISGCYKFGITSKNIELRNAWNKGYTLYPHKLATGDRLSIAYLEYNIKKYLDIDEEYINNLQDLFKAIRSLSLKS